MKCLFPRLSRRGQILIPAFFLLPCFVIFIYLIFETAKISREKIRHQFALDAASFIEMTNYSDFLNRTAYVNGAFPHRIFKETLGGANPIKIPRTNNTTDAILYDELYANAAFPKTKQADGVGELDRQKRWDIRYDDGNSPRGEGFNRLKYEDGEDLSSRNLGTFDFITQQNAQDFWISYQDAVEFYKLYAQIYSLLGSVEDAQWSVFKRLTREANFFRKSYWLNSGDCSGVNNCGWEGASTFTRDPLQANLHKIKKIQLWGRTYTPQNPFNPAPIVCNCDANNNAIDLTENNTDGLFQLATVPKRQLDRLGMKRGSYDVRQSWDPPGENYFNVDLKAFKPYVHATVSSDGGVVWNEEKNGEPSPTPKFQTRLYP
ncbi:MAG: hypothetical protein HY399_07555 [Elusimicrobia bacterium]|nr:hypothetical protein [Elusimicrobiota bacterium]